MHLCVAVDLEGNPNQNWGEITLFHGTATPIGPACRIRNFEKCRPRPMYSYSRLFSPQFNFCCTDEVDPDDVLCEPEPSGLEKVIGRHGVSF